MVSLWVSKFIQFPQCIVMFSYDVCLMCMYMLVCSTYKTHKVQTMCIPHARPYTRLSHLQSLDGNIHNTHVTVSWTQSQVLTFRENLAHYLTGHTLVLAIKWLHLISLELVLHLMFQDQYLTIMCYQGSSILTWIPINTQSKSLKLLLHFNRFLNVFHTHSTIVAVILLSLATLGGTSDGILTQCCSGLLP